MVGRPRGHNQIHPAGAYPGTHRSGWLQCQAHGGCLPLGTGYRGPSGCCVVLQGRAAPRNRAQSSGAHNPDVHIDKRTIRAILEQMNYQEGPDAPLPALLTDAAPATPGSRSKPLPALHVNAPSPPCHCPKNIKNQGTNPIWDLRVGALCTESRSHVGRLPTCTTFRCHTLTSQSSPVQATNCP